jgi:hypothetical protein
MYFLYFSNGLNISEYHSNITDTRMNLIGTMALILLALSLQTFIKSGSKITSVYRFNDVSN